MDVHAFADDDRTLSLAGLTWPGERGLAGHSDADVVAHAACDALFSAAGLGDLGTHFGTDRPELAGAAGVTLLAQAARIVTDAGFVIGNIAIQIIGNRPRLGPRRLEAQDGVVLGGGGTGVGLGDDYRRARAHRPRRGHRRDRHGDRVRLPALIPDSTSLCSVQAASSCHFRAENRPELSKPA